MTDLLTDFRAARRVSTPLIGITTPDPVATVQALCDGTKVEKFDDEEVEGAKLEWDFVRGLTPRNEPGKSAKAANGEFDATVNNPLGALVLAAKLPEASVLFIHLANRWIGEPAVIQAVANLRDAFKLNHRTLVLLGPSLDLPAELSGDVVVFDEPLPDTFALAEIVREQHQNASLEVDGDTVNKAVEAIQGLSAFAAEQVTAMSLRKSGIDLQAIWERKRQQIEQTPALKVFRDGDRFDQIGGCEVVKGFLSRVMEGQARPNAVVFIDEIEKMLGGTGDTSGVTQDQLGSLLSYMQDHKAAGMIFIGPPGAAKSAVAKAAGNHAGIPTIQLDLGAAKGSLVGQSEQQIRQALKVVTAVSNGRSLFIATCNSIGNLPPELRRRFTLGTFFFDLPDEAERNAIWVIHAEHFGVEAHRVTQRPNDEGWTGAEIRQACEIAWRLGCSVKEAAEFVVPVSRSAADAIKNLRKQAEGRFLSASRKGVYTRKVEAEPAKRGGRKLALAE